MNKLSLVEVKKIYFLKNIEFIDEKYVNYKTNHLLKCMICNHTWHSKLASLKQGYGCPKCGKKSQALKLKHSLEEVKEICKNNNLEFLDKEYINCATKYNFKCLICKYIWVTRFNSIKQNHGCPKCVSNKAKHSLEEVKEFCRKNNVIFLDKEYINSNFKHNLSCLKCNNIWAANINNIKYGCGCPKCGLQSNILYTKFSLEKVKNICANKNIEFIDENYINCYFKHNVKCNSCNLIWNSTISSINSGSGCPTCAKRKNEKILGVYLKQLFPHVKIESKVFNIKIFDSNGTKIRNKFIVDYYFNINDKEHIIEYNGHQHYQPTTFGNCSKEQAELNFIKQQIRDEFLRSYCKKQNINLIEIDGRKYQKENIANFLEKTFKEQNIIL